jgi:hypothetical protein
MALTAQSQRAWLNLTIEESVDPEREIMIHTIIYGALVDFPPMCLRIFGRRRTQVITS